MDKNKLIIAVLVIIATGLGFFGGVKYQQGKSSPTQQFAGNFNRNGINGNGQRISRNGNGMGATVGEIVNADSSSITVKMQDGSSKIVLFNDKTQINKAAQGSVSDLTTGTQVAVFGSSNSDGSVTAQNIQLNPQFGIRRQNGSTPSASRQ